MYDIITFSYGDTQSLYLRGQLTLFRLPHPNTDRIDVGKKLLLLWTRCEHLMNPSVKLMPQVTDEHCFSWIVFGEPNLRLMITTVMFAPTEDEMFFWIANVGVFQVCIYALIIGSLLINFFSSFIFFSSKVSFNNR